MKYTYKFISTYILLFLSLFLNNHLKAKDVLKNYPIELSVYDGQEALLMDWAIEESIEVKDVKVFGKKIGSSNYKILSNFPFNNGRFLDSLCEPGERYYYKIEILDINNNLFTSDLKMPSFGTCLETENIFFEAKNFQTMRELVIFYLLGQLKEYADAEVLSSIEVLLNYDSEQNKYSWIETFQPQSLKDNYLLIEKINVIIKNPDFEEKISFFESRFRNYMFLTPSDWKMSLGFEVKRLRSGWEKLYVEYPKAIKKLEDLDAVRIINSVYDKVNERSINLIFFNPQKLMNKEIFLLNGDEYIEIENPNIFNKNSYSTPIPSYWEYVDLMVNDTLVQKCPILSNEDVIYTLTGDLLSKKSNVYKLLTFEKEQSSLWLNEIQWNPSLNKIRIELAFEPLLKNRYSITHDLKTLWQFKPEDGFNENFADSSFFIDLTAQNSTFISLNLIEEDSIKVLEYINLDKTSFLKARKNDHLSWFLSNTETFGKTNKAKIEYDPSWVPELFVLYQNYPNPFNGQTRITFDLLNDAIVNLYVTDATGRIHDKLLEKEFITSGSYHFTWNGESRSTGIYFITLQVQVDQMPPAIISRKMIYLK